MAETTLSNEALANTALPQKLAVIHAIIWLLQSSESKLKTEGLMRESGSKDNANKVINAILNSETACQYSAHDYWTALQHIMRDINISFDSSYCETFKEWLKKNDDPGVLAKRFEAMLRTIIADALEPNGNKDDIFKVELIFLLMQLGLTVSQYSEINRMTTKNVAIVLSGNFLDFFNLIKTDTKKMSAMETQASFLEALTLPTRMQAIVTHLLNNKRLCSDLRSFVLLKDPSCKELLNKNLIDEFIVSQGSRWEEWKKQSLLEIEQHEKSIEEKKAKIQQLDKMYTAMCLSYKNHHNKFTQPNGKKELQKVVSEIQLKLENEKQEAESECKAEKEKVARLRRTLS